MHSKSYLLQVGAATFSNNTDLLGKREAILNRHVQNDSLKQQNQAEFKVIELQSNELTFPLRPDNRAKGLLQEQSISALKYKQTFFNRCDESNEHQNLDLLEKKAY